MSVTASAPAPRAPLAIADEVARVLAETAVARDRAGGSALRERSVLRASGLLAASIPSAHGGWGASWQDTLAIVRRIARADGSLAHLLGFHHLLVATVRLFGRPEQWLHAYAGTIRHGWFWGNALNPRDPRTAFHRAGDGSWRLTGTKSFCSGARDSNILVVSGQLDGTLLVAAIPTDRPGIRVLDDWDNFGQRQTDSGTVELEDVLVRDDEILRDPGPLATPFAALRPLLAQLVLVDVYLGIAEGAFEAASSITRTQTKPRDRRGIPANQDPFVLHDYGTMFVALEATRLLADRAAAAFDDAWSRGEALDAAQRGDVAVKVATAKVNATQAGLDIATRMFDVASARATTSSLGLDRYWRNLRTHTLHDPVDEKLRELGEWALSYVPPTPSFYS